jgi:hypothetical protein
VLPPLFAPSSVLPPASLFSAVPPAAAPAAASSGASGLANATGEYNCFLNSIVQALFRLECFQGHLLRSTVPHDSPEGVDLSRDLGVVHALQELFFALSEGADLRRDPTAASAQRVVAPTALRLALAALAPAGGEAGVHSMADAAEVLSSMYDCFLRVSKAFRGEREVSPIQLQFGMDVAEHVACGRCHTVTHAMRYTTFFHVVHRRAARCACAALLRCCTCLFALPTRACSLAPAAPRCATRTRARLTRPSRSGWPAFWRRTAKAATRTWAAAAR